MRNVMNITEIPKKNILHNLPLVLEHLPYDWHHILDHIIWSSQQVEGAVLVLVKPNQ